jgi:ferredoxin
MAYTRGDSKNIIVGAAAMFVSTSADWDPATVVFPDFVEDVKYTETLTDSAEGQALVRNIGYTTNGLELQFQPDFGEVQVDQLLDVAKLFKQGMQVNLNTAFAEASLQNLLVAIAAPSADYNASATIDNPIDAGTISSAKTLDLTSGSIGECPVEAITEGDIYVIDADACISCGACAEVCPTGAILAD